MSGSEQNRMRGIIFAVSAGILWGFVPVYIYFPGDVGPFEVVAHRSLWSLVLLVGLVIWRKQMKLAQQVFCNKKLLVGLAISTLFLLANWTVFVYAVQSGHVVSAALGYFIYPLCTVLLGILVLGERLDKWALIAIGLVCLGVMAKAMIIMDLPWISLALAGSFSLYAA